MRGAFLISYDIADDKRRTSVYKTLLDYGDHVQYSVFICELNARELMCLRGLLDDAIHHDEDQVMVLHLGPNMASLQTALKCLGRPYEPACRVQVV